jgi:hypothetical protein
VSAAVDPESELRRAMKIAEAGGLTIVREEFGVDIAEYSGAPRFGRDKRCCAFGALLLSSVCEVERRPDGLRPDAEAASRALAKEKFGWTDAQFNAFLGGFDDGDADGVDGSPSEIGRKLSLEFVGPFAEVDA